MDLLNQIYPVGSLFICKTGTGSPASKYGGNWQCLAENVELPLGDYAPVITGASNIPTNLMTGNNMNFTTPTGAATTEDKLLSINSGALRITGADASGNYGRAVPSNLYADLSNASNAIPGVDVWQRIEEI